MSKCIIPHKPPPPRSILTHSALCKFFLPLRAFCSFFGTLYVAVAPYELFLGARALCRYRSIRARAPYRQSRYGTPAATLLPASGQYAPLSPYRLRQYGLSRALCRYRSIRARGAAEAAVAVVKNCCECDEWPLQSSSMDDCMTNAKKSSKEPPVVRVPSCTYSHALHIQSQAPSSLRRPSPVLTTK